MTDFQLYWRFEALKIAAMEQLQYKTHLDDDELFERARMIYDKGYLFKLNEWHKGWETTEESVVEEKEEVREKIPVEAEEGHKVCPSCYEQVPEKWKKHGYKKDGSSCGHVFQ